MKADDNYIGEDLVTIKVTGSMVQWHDDKQLYFQSFVLVLSFLSWLFKMATQCFMLKNTICELFISAGIQIALWEKFLEIKLLLLSLLIVPICLGV